jgi:3'-5' exoribonuclease
MRSTATVVTRLGDLVDGQEAVCYAVLAKKVRGTTKTGKPFLRCVFRDKKTSLEAPLWHGDPLLEVSETWADGVAYRIEVRSELKLPYGMQLVILSIRPAADGDEAEGYNVDELFESSSWSGDDLLQSIHQRIDKYIADPHLKGLVVRILAENDELLRKMPAASAMHHAYTRGLLEHMWSMSRVAAMLLDHYGDCYYKDLNPPLDKGVVMAAVVLHDIGKLKELAYSPVEARYTKEGQLLGHIVMGRDMVRDAARGVDGFPEETLLCLEHAILSHHGKREFGAPVLPATLEALLVSFIDDLDAKMNTSVRHRMDHKNGEDFTDKVWALDNRRFYRGIPVEPGDPCPDVEA